MYLVMLKIRGILLSVMDKIYQILAVFALIMLLVSRFIRGREVRYHSYDFIRRFKPPLPAEVEERLQPAAPGAPQPVRIVRKSPVTPTEGARS